MNARLWTALLLLAGVFALHGLQCTAAGSSGTSDIAAVVTSSHVLAVPMTALTGGHGDGLLPDPTPGAAVAVDTGHGSAPHDTPAHLWTVCLAVLAAGLVALLTTLITRRAVLSRRLTRVRVRVAGGLASLRPPDLSALCLLRI